MVAALATSCVVRACCFCFASSPCVSPRRGHGQFVDDFTQVDVLLGMLPPKAAALAVDWAMTRTPLLPTAEATSDGWTRTQLSKLAKAMFKQCGNATCESAVRAAEDEGFEALRALAAQQQRQLCSSCASTHGIIVRCTSVFVPQQQRQQHGKDSYLFSYRITIHNTASNPCTVKLLGRQWEILDGDGNVCGQVPRGSHGVVGHTPSLQPNETFEYYSGCELPTPEGRMSGSFQMINLSAEPAGPPSLSADDGRGDAHKPPATETTVYDVDVAPFALRGPRH